MSGWLTTLTIPDLDKTPWTCPYCQQENPGGFPGQIAWVSKGHGDSQGSKLTPHTRLITTSVTSSDSRPNVSRSSVIA